MDFSLIQKRISEIEKLETENKTAKELLKSEIEDDPVYMETMAEVKEVLSKKKRIKDEILSKESGQKILRDIKENMEEITTLKDMLSAELIEFYRESNIDEIQDASGESRKFKITVRLLPKKGKFQGRNNFGQYSKELD